MTNELEEKLKEVVDKGELVKLNKVPELFYVGYSITEVWKYQGQYFRLSYNDTEGRLSEWSTFERVVPVEQTIYTRIPMG